MVCFYARLTKLSCDKANLPSIKREVELKFRYIDSLTLSTDKMIYVQNIRVSRLRIECLSRTVKKKTQTITYRRYINL